MTEAERKARKEQLRLYVFGAALLTFFIAYAAASWAISSNVEKQRDSCEGGNKLRSALVFLGEALVDINEERAQTSSSEAERETNQTAAERYQEFLDLVVDSVQTQETPDSVRRDCEAAYPMPPPWNWID